MRLLAISALIWLSGCALQGLNPEERADITAAGAYQAIAQIQDRANNLHSAGVLSDADTIAIIEATLQINDLVAEIEAASDVVEGAQVGCIQVQLGENATEACNRSDITQILLVLRDMVE